MNIFQREPVDLVILILKVIIIICGQYLAYLLEFGAVFFIIATLYLIWNNLGDESKRDKSTLSAYSVFNPKQKQIQGTVTTDKLLNHKLF